MCYIGDCEIYLIVKVVVLNLYIYKILFWGDFV